MSCLNISREMTGAMAAADIPAERGGVKSA